MGNMFEFSAAADGGSPTIEMCRLLHFYFLFFFSERNATNEGKKKTKDFCKTDS